MTSLDYLAGFLDGEGCFTYYSGPVVECSNTYLPTLQALHSIFGGDLHLSGPGVNKAIYRWRVCGASAVATAAALIPYLWEKRPQAEILTRIMRYPKRSAMRQRLKERLKELKR